MHDTQAMTRQQQRITGGHLAHRSRGVTSVIQVMLFRRILPCQARQEPMWKFNPVGAWTLQRFFGMKHEDMWKLLFKTQKSWPETTEDLGYDNTHAATSVSSLMTLLCEPKEHTKLSIFFCRAGRRRRSVLGVRPLFPKI